MVMRFIVNIVINLGVEVNMIQIGGKSIMKVVMEFGLKKNMILKELGYTMKIVKG